MDANDVFGLRSVPQQTIDEMEARTTTKVQQWHASRKPWVHIMSMADKCATDQGTYFGLGVGPQNSQGGRGYIDNFERPQPVVESVEVKKLGELGTTRKTFITIKAFTDDQLNNIAKCYLIPHMSVRVQWGWNVQADQTHLKTPKPITGYDLDHNDALIFAKIADTQTEYASFDGVQGKVVNYDVSFDQNIWTIVIEIVAASGMITEVQIEDQSNTCYCVESGINVKTGEKEEEKEDPTKTSSFRAVLEGLKSDADLSFAKQIYAKYRGKSNEVYRLEYYCTDEVEGFWNNVKHKIIPIKVQKTFISLGALQRIISCTTQGTSTEPVDFEINSDTILISDPNIPADPFGTEGNYMYLACADPRIGYIPGGMLKAYPQAGTPEPFRATAIASDLSDAVILDGILINVEHCLKVLGSTTEPSKDSVIVYLKKILQDLNYNCGNPWELDIIDSSTLEPKLQSGKTPSRLSIVDLKRSKKQSEDKTFYFKAKSQQSNVRSLGMKLLLPEAMKTQALYGGKDSNQTPKTTETCNVRFSAFTNISGRNLTVPEPAPQPPNCIGGNKNCAAKEVLAPPTLGERFQRLFQDASDKTVSGVREELLAHNNSNKANKCKGVILPLEFNVTIDGIGGFAWGQSVDCDRFPEDYRKYYKHQVTAVEHTITHADWKTNIVTVARFHPDE